MLKENIINARLQWRYDTLDNWLSSNDILKSGEAAVAVIAEGVTGSGLTPPAVGIKIGDGVSKFSELSWVQAIAGDVPAWAKDETLETINLLIDAAVAVNPGPRGEQGDSAYVFFAYANSEDGKVDFTLTPEPDMIYEYLGEYTSDTDRASKVQSDYTWHRMTKELARIEAEKLRRQSETERANAETLRVANETARQNAESERVSAEEKRAIDNAAAVSAANTAATNAQTIADTLQSKLDAGEFDGADGDKITDTVTGETYKFALEDGYLYFEEVTANG